MCELLRKDTTYPLHQSSNMFILPLTTAASAATAAEVRLIQVILVTPIIIIIFIVRMTLLLYLIIFMIYVPLLSRRNVYINIKLLSVLSVAMPLIFGNETDSVNIK